MPLIVVTTSPRVAPGLLTPAAWAVLSRGRVLTGSADHPYLPYLDEAGVAVETVTPDPAALARDSRTETVVWLAAQDGDEDLMRAVGHAAIALDEPPVIEVVPGSYDLPGARLLDLVQVMDRLRRECPWDQGQTHESLVPYLVEEAYEVLETIDQGDYPALREELGDLLLQVVFHARLAQERLTPGEVAGEADGDGFDIDDVAAGIVEKLVRRHPHVFSGVTVSGAGEVSDNWETIKAAERAAKGETGSVLSGVPMGQPALSLAAQLLRRAGRADAPAELADDLPGSAGARLFDLVRQAGDAGIDPEAELRAAAREYRRRVEQWESEAAARGTP
ncbi:MazG family protein [Microbispora sp. RL4-1S]|uniref:MazG family protein n=1 Tax=Microbispora oryzae TaxID=2806554 RepID=A0A940WUH9_9ACTN|nr:MazG family protein [Microbispora oryzae]MBP2707199.1 MazG family protein [Microbispora oryzae]